jgi:hypothetical protein
MRFTLEVGDKEKITVEYYRNWFTGSMQILVDGHRVAHDSPLSASTHMNYTLKSIYEIQMSKPEQHKVTIERVRPLLFGGVRPNRYRVFVDGQLALEQKGY